MRLTKEERCIVARKHCLRPQELVPRSSTATWQSQSRRCRQEYSGDAREQLWFDAGQLVHAMPLALQLDPGSVMVMVNGRRVAREYVLHAGDQVKPVCLITGR